MSKVENNRRFACKDNERLAIENRRGFASLRSMLFPLHLQTFPVGGHSVSLFVPDEDSVKEAYTSGQIAFPYWSRVWPAAKGLAAFLLQHPQYTATKRVVELGAGLGLPSLVAAQKATAVLCTDLFADAVAVVQKTARHHGLQNLQTAVMDWRQLPEDFTTDTLLLSDVAYEPAAFAQLWQLLQRLLQAGTTVLLATPQRLTAKEFVAPLLARCASHTVVAVHEEQTTPVSVMVLQQ